MKGKTASFLFMCICILTSILLMKHVITIFISGSVFAIALILFGGLSKGFRKT